MAYSVTSSSSSPSTYDLHTPFGIRPGQVTPEGEMRSRKFSEAVARAQADEARSAQMRVLKEAMAGQGQGGGPMGGDPFFAENEKPNLPVSGLKPTLQPGDYGTHQYFQTRENDRLETQRNQAKLPADQADARLREQQAESKMKSSSELDAFASGMGSGEMSDADIIKAAILQGNVAGQPADIAGIMKSRSESRMQEPRANLEYEAIKAQLEEMQRKMTEQDEAKKLGRDPNLRIEDFLAQNPNVGSALDDRLGKFTKRDEAWFGSDPDEQDISGVLAERDEIVRVLTGRGYPADVALRQANMILSRKMGDSREDMAAVLRQRAGL